MAAKKREEKASVTAIKSLSKLHNKYTDAHGIVPSVTTVLGEFEGGDGLVEWGNRLGFEGISSGQYKTISASIGTAVHSRIHAYLNGETYTGVDIPPILHRFVETGFESFLSWWQLKPRTVVATEVKLNPSELGIDAKFGGTADLIITADDGSGGLELVDFKTGNYVAKHVYAQLAAYAHLWNESHLQKITVLSSLQLDKDRVAIGYNPTPYDPAFLEYFMTLLSAYNQKKALKW